jgi:hypothetical protein
MAKPSAELIQALRSTANTLQQTPDYAWQHIYSYTATLLALEIIRLQEDEIHKRMMQRYSAWSKQLSDYCTTCDSTEDNLISEMQAFGLDRDDFSQLQNLSGDTILSSLPADERKLQPALKPDVIKYILAWATQLENKLLDDIYLPQSITNTETIL